MKREVFAAKALKKALDWQLTTRRVLLWLEQNRRDKEW
jgi:hypothetical protein